MGHSAFTLHTVLPNLSFEATSVALCPHTGDILVGALDGSLRLFSPPPSPPSSSSSDHLPSTNEPDGWHAQAPAAIAPGFASCAVSQLHAMARRRLAIALAGSVRVVALPELDTVANLDGSDGAQLCEWDESARALWVAQGSTLSLFVFDGDSSFSFQKQVTAPETVQAVACIGKSTVCVAAGGKYHLLRLQQGSTAAAAGGKGGAAAAGAADPGAWWTTLMPWGVTAPPLVVTVSDSEFLVGKDSLSLFLSATTGRASRDHGVAWSRLPSHLAICPPHVVGKLANVLEVRGLHGDHSLVQTVQLPGGSGGGSRLRGAPGAVGAASPVVVWYGPRGMLLVVKTGVGGGAGGCVVHLRPVSPLVQVQKLARTGRYEEALAMCESQSRQVKQESEVDAVRVLSPPTASVGMDAETWTLLESEVRTQYGEQLFSQGEFEKSMQQFLQAPLPPPLPIILRLFPFLPRHPSLDDLPSWFPQSILRPQAEGTQPEGENWDESGSDEDVHVEEDEEDGEDGASERGPGVGTQGRARAVTLEGSARQEALAELVVYLCRRRQREAAAETAGENNKEVSSAVMDTALATATFLLLPPAANSSAYSATTYSSRAQEQPQQHNLQQQQQRRQQQQLSQQFNAAAAAKTTAALRSLLPSADDPSELTAPGRETAAAGAEAAAESEAAAEAEAAAAAERVLLQKSPLFCSSNDSAAAAALRAALTQFLLQLGDCVDVQTCERLLQSSKRWREAAALGFCRQRHSEVLQWLRENLDADPRHGLHGASDAMEERHGQAQSEVMPREDVGLVAAEGDAGDLVDVLCEFTEALGLAKQLRQQQRDALAMLVQTAPQRALHLVTKPGGLRLQTGFVLAMFKSHAPPRVVEAYLQHLLENAPPSSPPLSPQKGNAEGLYASPPPTPAVSSTNLQLELVRLSVERVRVAQQQQLATQALDTSAAAATEASSPAELRQTAAGDATAAVEDDSASIFRGDDSASRAHPCHQLTPSSSFSTERQRLRAVLSRLPLGSVPSAIHALPSEGFYEEKAELLARWAREGGGGTGAAVSAGHVGPVGQAGHAGGEQEEDGGALHLSPELALFLALVLYSRKLKSVGKAFALCDELLRGWPSFRTAKKPFFLTGKKLPPVAQSPPHLTLLRILVHPLDVLPEFLHKYSLIYPLPLASSSSLHTHSSPPVAHPAAAVTVDAAAAGTALATQPARLGGPPTAAAPSAAAASGAAAAAAASSAADELEGIGLDESVMEEEAAALLASCWQLLDPLQVLDLVPSSMRLHKLEPYLRAVFQATSERRRNGAVVKSLRRAENLKVRDELIRTKSKAVRITRDRACSICYKRIGTSVFATYPSGAVMHYVCYQHSNSRHASSDAS